MFFLYDNILWDYIEWCMHQVSGSGGGVLLVEINRPEKRNCVNRETGYELYRCEEVT